jgi:para-nitrobenzyl esterase
MVGSTRHEMLMFLAQERGGLPDLDAAAVRERLLPMLGDRTDEVIAVFERSNPEASGTELFATIQSAASMGMGSIRLAERKLAGGTAPVYMYLLTWRSPFDGGKYGAPHGMCVPLSMDNCWSAQWSDVPEARGVAARMNQAWIDLAAVGDPNHADLPKWAPYSLDERATMFFDDPCVVVDDPFPEERAVLDGVPGMFG